MEDDLKDLSIEVKGLAKEVSQLSDALFRCVNDISRIGHRVALLENNTLSLKVQAQGKTLPHTISKK